MKRSSTITLGVLSTLVLLLVCGAVQLVQAQSVSATPNTLSDTVVRADLVASNVVTLTGTTTLAVVQTAPWTVNVTVAVSVPATGTATANVENALGLRDKINNVIVFPGVTSTAICNSTSGCASIDFQLNLASILNGASGALGTNAYTFTITLSLRDGSNVEVATNTLSYEVALGDIVAIGVSGTIGPQSVQRADFADQFFPNATTGFGTFDVAVVAATNYAVTGAVTLAPTGFTISSPAMTIAARLSVVSGNDDGGITNNATGFVNLGNTIGSGTSLWTGPNTEGGALNTFTGRLELRLDLDALGNATSGGTIDVTVTVRITET